jgi:hypothetical protein
LHIIAFIPRKAPHFFSFDLRWYFFFWRRNQLAICFCCAYPCSNGCRIAYILMRSFMSHQTSRGTCRIPMNKVHSTLQWLKLLNAEQWTV